MKKQLGIIILCSLGLITACAPKSQVSDNMIETETTIETSESKSFETEAANDESSKDESSEHESTAPDGAEEAFETYKDLSLILGASDASIRNSFGGGKENKTEDGTILIGREYQTSFQGEPITMYTIYDDAEEVMMVQVIFSGKDSQSYKDGLSRELNVKPETPAGGEAGSIADNWNSAGIQYTLHRSSGENILEIIVLPS